MSMKSHLYMSENQMTLRVVCYHCKETFECDFPGHSVMKECPVCEGSNWVMAPASENTEI